MAEPLSRQAEQWHDGPPTDPDDIHRMWIATGGLADENARLWAFVRAYDAREALDTGDPDMAKALYDLDAARAALGDGP